MLGIVNDSRIARRRQASALVVNRQIGKITAGPGFAAIGRSGETDVRAAVGVNTRYLKGAHDSRAPRECVRLNFGPMLTGRVVELVSAEPYQRK